MVEYRKNKNTERLSWGFNDGVYFYPYGNSEVAQAMASLDLMRFKSTGSVDGLKGDLVGEWDLISQQ